MADGTGALLREFKRGDAFIETGTFDGSGILSGLRAGFSKIATIELDDERWLAVRDNFGEQFLVDNNLTGVEITTLWGSSEWMLRHPLIRDYASLSPTYMLDAHWSGEGTAGEAGYDPWEHELDAIAEISAGMPAVIMLDDVEPSGPRGFEAVCELVLKRFKHARITFEHGSHPQYYRPDDTGMLIPWRIAGSDAEKIEAAKRLDDILARDLPEAKRSEMLSLKHGYLSLTRHPHPSIAVAVI